MTPTPQITITGKHGLYKIQSSQSVGLQAEWETLTRITIPNDETVFYDSTPTNVASRFYRVAIIPTCDIAPYLKPSDLASMAGEWGGGTNSFESIFISHQCRIRQSGDIFGARIITDEAGCSSLRIRIWRNEGEVFNLIGESENVADRLLPRSTNSIVFSDSIRGVNVGDYYGYFQTLTGSPCAFPSVHFLTKGGGCYRVDKSPTESGHNWLSESQHPFVVPIWLQMEAPEIVAIGDSITQGIPSNSAFTQEQIVAVDFDHYWVSMLAQNLGWSYQNMGHGSDTTSQILQRLTNDVIDLHPKIALLEGGINDILKGVDTSLTISNWAAIITAIKTNRIIPVAIGILPCNGASNGQMRERDRINAAISNYVKELGGVMINGIDDALGQFRLGGDEGNKWDFKDGFNADAYHLSPVGSKAICDLVTSQIINVEVEK